MSTDQTPAEPTGAPDEPAAGSPAPAPQRHRRVGTIVWGVVIAVVGAGVLAVAAGYRIDVQLAAIGLLVAAGLAMIVGPLLAAGRRDRH